MKKASREMAGKRKEKRGEIRKKTSDDSIKKKENTRRNRNNRISKQK